MRDPADDLIARCAESPLASPVAPPEPWARPNTVARRFGFDAQEPRRFEPGTAADAERARRLQEFNDLLGAAYQRMFPPHLYPPLRSEPYMLRANLGATLPGAGTTTTRILDHVQPDGSAFTVQECHLRANAGGAACQVGFIVTRGEARLFSGDELRTRNPDGSHSVQPPILPIAATDGTVWITSPFTVTVLPGERIGIAVSCVRTGPVTLTLHLQLRGYRYPSEQTR